MKAWQFTNEKKAFVVENYLSLTDKQMSEKLGCSRNTIQTFRNSLGLLKPEKRDSFKKGNTPWCKGKKMPEGWGGETRFKPGVVHSNNIPAKIGDVSKMKSHKYTYLFIRVENGWKPFHRYVWEETMGPIPDGCVVQFKDKNRLNCEPSNLYIITRDQQLIQNDIKRFSPELQKLIRLSGKLKRKIRHHEKQD